MTALGREAWRKAGELLGLWLAATTTDEREDVARAIGILSPNGGRPLAEVAEFALKEKP